MPGMKELFGEIREKAAEDFAVATEGLDEQEIINLGLRPWDPAEEVMAIFRPGDHFGRPNTISVLEGGERKWYEVDEELFAALQGLNREQLDSFSRWLGTPARTLRAGATLAPEFLIRNPLRDQVMAFVQSEYGYIPFVDMARGVFELIKKGDLYQEWLSAGGYRAALTGLDRKSMQVAMRHVLDGGGIQNVVKTELEALALLRESMAQAARGQFRAAAGKAGEAGSAALDPLRAASALMEDATRLGEFRLARQQEGLFGEARGLTGRLQAGGRQPGQVSKEVLQRAALASREVSTDFARHGAKTATLRHLSAFWNARLQGYDRLARGAKNDPAGFAVKAFSAITLPSLLEYYVNMDDPEYWEQPQWKRDLFWLIPKDDGSREFWALPKPFELGLIFGTLPVRILDSALGGPGGSHEVRDFLYESVVKGEVSGFLPQPTALMPLIENTVNYSFFLRRPIVPRGEQDVRARYQAGPYTSEIAQLLGRWVPGESGYSPRKIDNLLYAYTAGLGRIATEVTDPLLEGRLPFTAGDNAPPASRLSDVPGIRGVQARRAGLSSESVERFYETLSRARGARRTLDFLDNQEEDEAYQRELNDDEAANLRAILPSLEAASRELSEIRAEIAAVRRDRTMTAEDKRTELDRLELEGREVAQDAINRQLPGGDEDDL